MQYDQNAATERFLVSEKKGNAKTRTSISTSRLTNSKFG